MRFFIIILCLVVYSLNAQIPKNPNLTDKNGRRQGKWTLTFDKNWRSTSATQDVAFYRLIEYKNDKPLGIVRDFFKSGKIQWEGELSADRPKEIPEGLAKFYNESGVLISEENYEHGLRQGLTKRYADDGTLKSESMYEKGIRHGIDKAYYSDGKLKYEVNFINGIQNGFYKQYNEQGKLVSDGNLENNQWHGPITFYNSKGEKVAEGSYNHGVMDTGWKFYGEGYENLQAQGRYYLEKSPRRALQPFLDAGVLIEKEYGKQNKIYYQNLKQIGICAFNLGLYNTSLKINLERFALAKKMYKENDVEFIDVYNSIGASYEFLRNSYQAEKNYLRALDLLAIVNPSDKYFSILLKNNIARLYFLSNSKVAISMFKENIEALEQYKMTNGSLYSTVCGNLSGAFFYEKNYAEAEKYARMALSVGDQSTDWALSASLAPIYMEQSRYTRAKHAFEHDTLRLREQFGSTSAGYADLMRMLGKTNMYLLDFATAEKNFKQSIAIVDENKINKELMLFDHAYFLEAKNEYSKSLQIQQSSVNNILRDLVEQQPYQSESEKLSAFEWNKIIFDFFNSTAIRHAKEYPDYLSSVVDYWMVTKGLVINSAIQWKKSILNSGDRKLITEYNEWLVLKESLSKYHKLSDQVRKSEHINLDSLEVLANRLEKKLTERSELFTDVQSKQNVSWRDVQKKLEKGDAAIEIIRIRKYGIEKSGIDTSATKPVPFRVTGLTDTIQYAALIIKPETRNYPELVLLENGNELEGKWLTFYRNAVLSQTEDKNSYDQYWGRIKKHLKGVKRIYFSADGVYNQINLNTLLNSKSNRYLIDEIDLRYLTSTRDLLAVKTSETANQYALLIGNPNYSSESTEGKSPSGNERDLEMSYQLSKERGSVNLAPLPGSEVEVDKVGELLRSKGWKPEVLKGNEALEENVKSSYKPKVLHIATHGFFQKDVGVRRKETPASSDQFFENPLVRSGVLLAGSAKTFKNNDEVMSADSEAEDGVLTAYEAMNLNLSNTELVVLSACETGLGEIKNGDGVYGLQRAFKVAGAKSIIMSLWNVNDLSTQELMTSFYQIWLTGGEKQLAFRQAQETLRKKYPNPYYWGAFVMLGE